MHYIEMHCCSIPTTIHDFSTAKINIWDAMGDKLYQSIEGQAVVT